MSKNPEYVKGHGEDFRGRSGAFFEELGLELFRAERPENPIDGDGVIYDGPTNWLLEFKSSDNNHPWRIKTEQFDRHASHDKGGFLYNGCLYVLFQYKNKKIVNGRRYRPLARLKPENLTKFLLQNLGEILVLETGFLAETLRDRSQIHTLGDDGRKRFAVEKTKTDLLRAMDDGDNGDNEFVRTDGELILQPPGELALSDMRVPIHIMAHPKPTELALERLNMTEPKVVTCL